MKGEWMSENREKINIQIDTYRNCKHACVTVGLRGGFALCDYKGSNGEIKKLNRAFFNVFRNYLRLTQGVSTKASVMPTCTLFSIEESPEQALLSLKALMENIASFAPTEEGFQAAKQKTLDAFSAYYKDEKFRARYKSYEVLHSKKGFLLKDLIEDILAIDYAAFSESACEVISPGSTCVHVFGNVEPAEVATVADNLDESFRARSTVQWGIRGSSPLIRDDSHIHRRGERLTTSSVLSLLFDEQVTVASRRLIADFLAESPGFPSCEVTVDSFDSGLAVSQEAPERLKDKLSLPSVEQFETRKKRVMSRYVYLLSRRPKDYGALAADMALMGLSLNQYLEELQLCSWESFARVLSGANLQIVESQVVIGGKMNNG